MGRSTIESAGTNDDEEVFVGIDDDRQARGRRPSLKILGERVELVGKKDDAAVVMGEGIQDGEIEHGSREDELRERVEGEAALAPCGNESGGGRDCAEDEVVAQLSELTTGTKIDGNGSATTTSPSGDSKINSHPSPPVNLNSSDPTTPTSSLAAPKFHPLQHKWTFLFQHQRSENLSKASDQATATTTIGMASTVEEFCRIFNWVKRPSQLKLGNSVGVFKVGLFLSFNFLFDSLCFREMGADARF